jgi:hypothetical protein
MVLARILAIPAVFWNEDRNWHTSQNRRCTEAFAAALQDTPVEKIAPMRLAARRLRPGNFGSNPIRFGLAAHGKTRSRNDQRVLIATTGKGADLVGPGPVGDERLVSSLCKQLWMVAAVCQQGRDDGQFDAAVAPVFEHVEYRRAAVSLQ